MKSETIRNVFLSLVILIACGTNPSHAQKSKKEQRFPSVNLSKLKNTVNANLLKDGLIASKKESFYLSLKTNSIALNEIELSTDLTLKYQSILSPFEIGSGVNRKIYISPQGTAVGDFTKKGFYGVAKGTFADDVLGTGLPGLK